MWASACNLKVRCGLYCSCLRSTRFGLSGLRIFREMVSNEMATTGDSDAAESIKPDTRTDSRVLAAQERHEHM